MVANKNLDAKTVLNGLVLTGGYSTRMGRNKSLIKWHGKEQMYYMADQLKNYCQEVYISCRKDQQETVHSEYRTITDRYENIGPLSGILSAFDFNSPVAWLVVACDMPLLKTDTINYLIEQRDPAMIATAFQNPHNGLPEPLIAIWEPAAFQILRSSLERKELSPRKILLDNSVKLISAKNNQLLQNVNTPREAEEIRKWLC